MWKITGNRWTTESCMSGQVPAPPLGPWFAVPNCALARGFRAARDFPRCVSRPGRGPSRCTGTSPIVTGLLDLAYFNSGGKKGEAVTMWVAAPGDRTEGPVAGVRRRLRSRRRRTVPPSSRPSPSTPRSSVETPRAGCPPVAVWCLIISKKKRGTSNAITYRKGSVWSELLY